jgi:hypothetical protein
LLPDRAVAVARQAVVIDLCVVLVSVVFKLQKQKYRADFNN